MSYRVRKRKHLFHVIEKKTDFSVFSTTDQKQARSVNRSLNLGSGFAGFTPAFFMQNFRKKEESTN